MSGTINLCCTAHLARQRRKIKQLSLVLESTWLLRRRLIAKAKLGHKKIDTRLRLQLAVSVIKPLLAADNLFKYVALM